MTAQGQEKPDVVALLRAADDAMAAYAVACQQAGYGWRSAAEDSRFLEELERHQDDGDLTVDSVELGMRRVLETRKTASPFDDDGYVYQGVMDEISDTLNDLGLVRDDEPGTEG